MNIESTAVITTTPTKFALPLKNLHMVASLAVFADSSRSPLTLSLVSVQVALGTMTAVSTDRYCAAKLELAVDQEIFAGFYLSPAAVKFIAAQKAPKYFTGSVDITIRDGELTLSYLGQTFTEPMFTGSYPAIATVFDGLVTGPVETLSFKPGFVGKLAKLVGDDGKKLDGAWKFTFHTGPNSNRPNPFIASNSAYSVLVQPNLLKN